MNPSDYFWLIVNSVIRFFTTCEHEFELVRIIREQNLRTGHEHESEVYRCPKCEKYRTVELS